MTSVSAESKHDRYDRILSLPDALDNGYSRGISQLRMAVATEQRASHPLLWVTFPLRSGSATAFIMACIALLSSSLNMSRYLCGMYGGND